MTANVNEAVQKIKVVGATNARVVPMAGQAVDGLHQVEIRENGSWYPVVSGIKRQMGEDLINQATNRVILG